MLLHKKTYAQCRRRISTRRKFNLIRVLYAKQGCVSTVLHNILCEKDIGTATNNLLLFVFFFHKVFITPVPVVPICRARRVDGCAYWNINRAGTCIFNSDSFVKAKSHQQRDFRPGVSCAHACCVLCSNVYSGGPVAFPIESTLVR